MMIVNYLEGRNLTDQELVQEVHCGFMISLMTLIQRRVRQEVFHTLPFICYHV